MDSFNDIIIREYIIGTQGIYHQPLQIEICNLQCIVSDSIVVLDHNTDRKAGVIRLANDTCLNRRYKNGTAFKQNFVGALRQPKQL